jgi:Tfp pilus assembly protein FimT
MGYSLVETLLVIVVIGLCMLVTVPKFQDALAQGNLRSTRAKVMSRYSAARATSMASGRATYLHMHGNQVYVTAIGRRMPGNGTQDTITPAENMYTMYGVSVASNVDSVRIDRNGIGGGAATIRLLKGDRADTVEISQYGRVETK